MRNRIDGNQADGLMAELVENLFPWGIGSRYSGGGERR
jgi:hypothetical protein